MDVEHISPPVPAREEPAEVAQALQRLRHRGARVTGPRRAVIETLAAVGGHPGAEELCAALEDAHPSVHRATVYRTLETLADLGVVAHVHLSHGTTVYHLVGGEQGHLHARCRVCGRVVDLSGDLLDGVGQVLSRERGFTLDPRHVALSGTCRACGDSEPV